MKYDYDNILLIKLSSLIVPYICAQVNHMWFQPNYCYFAETSDVYMDGTDGF